MRGRAPIKTGICLIVAGLFATIGCTPRGIHVLPPRTIRTDGNTIRYGTHDVKKPYNQKEIYNIIPLEPVTPTSGPPYSPEDSVDYKP